MHTRKKQKAKLYNTKITTLVMKNTQTQYTLVTNEQFQKEDENVLLQQRTHEKSWNLLRKFCHFSSKL